MTLEARLLSYDWENQFNTFQEATLFGTFKSVCSGAQNKILPVSIGYEVELSFIDLRLQCKAAKESDYTIVKQYNKKNTKLYVYSLCRYQNI